MKIDPLSLVDIDGTTRQLKNTRATIWRHIRDGKFPTPICGGRARACWLQVQITNYLYQKARYGEWSQERSDLAIDRAYEASFNAIGSGLESNNSEI